MDLNDTVNKKAVAEKKASAPLLKPFILAPPEGDKSSKFYKLAVAAHLMKPGTTRTFRSRERFDTVLAKSIFYKKAFRRLIELHRREGWDVSKFIEDQVQILLNIYGARKNDERIVSLFGILVDNNLDIPKGLEKECQRFKRDAEKMKDLLRYIRAGKVYSNLVLAIPHAVGKVKFPAIEKLDEVKDALLSETEWCTDKLFPIEDKSIRVVKFPYSQLEVDAECSEDDPNRIAAFRLPGKGCYQGEIPPFREYQYRQAWSQYRTDIMEAASRGDKPFIIDCRAFSSTLASNVDVCLGFNEDDSKPPSKVLEDILLFFTRKNYRVRRNNPYSGTIVPEGYQGPSLMIAVNRSTYIDSDTATMVLKIEKLREVLREVYEYLLEDVNLDN